MNNNTKHTPGPWKECGLAVYTEAKRKHWLSPRDPRQSLICNVRDNYEGNEEDVAENPPSLAEAEANARLIAAAPELLEALEHYISVCPPHNVESDDKWHKARAAIAKAKGEA